MKIETFGPTIAVNTRRKPVKDWERPGTWAKVHLPVNQSIFMC